MRSEHEEQEQQQQRRRRRHRRRRPGSLPEDMLAPHQRRSSALRAVLSSSILCVVIGSALLLLNDHGLSRFTSSNIRSIHLRRQLRALIASIDDDVSAADWPPSSLVDSVVDDYNRVVVCAVTCAAIQFADNWAQSLSALGVNNFLFIPLDSQTADVLEEAWPGHVVPPLPGLESPEAQNPNSAEYAKYGHRDFKVMTATRPTFLKAFVEKGYKIMYNDADMVWKRNVLDEVEMLLNEHKDQQSIEEDEHEHEGNEGDAVLVQDGPQHSMCSCMIYLNPTEASQNLLGTWRSEILTEKYNHDQEAFNVALDKDNDFTWIRGDANKFPAGFQYFHPPVSGGNDRKQAWRDDNVALVHVNWITGMEHKRFKLQMFGNWHPSGRLPESYQCQPETKKETEEERERRDLQERKEKAKEEGHGWDEERKLEIWTVAKNDDNSDRSNEEEAREEGR